MSGSLAAHLSDRGIRTIHCFGCKGKRGFVNPRLNKTKRGAWQVGARCSACNTAVSRFIAAKDVKGAR